MGSPRLGERTLRLYHKQHLILLMGGKTLDRPEWRLVDHLLARLAILQGAGTRSHGWILDKVLLRLAKSPSNLQVSQSLRAEQFDFRSFTR